MKKLRLSAIALAMILLAAFAAAPAAFAAGDIAADTVVSGTDASSSDVTPTDAAHLYDYPLSDFAVDYHNLTFSAPKLDGAFSASYTNKEIQSEFGQYNLSEILDYNDYYSGNYSYLYYASTANQDVLMYIIYNSTNYSQFVGDYSALSDEQLEDACAISLFGNDEYPTVRKLGGNVFLCQQYDDEEYGTSIMAQTVVKGGMYTVCIEMADPTAVDLARAEMILGSVKVGGVKLSHIGAASRTTVIILLVIIILLLIAVALLAFFIIRFHCFARAAGSRFAIIGFNMPPKANHKDIE